MRWLIACALLAGCGDNKAAKPTEDAGIDATSSTLKGCLDTATLPMAPAGQLPCDLVPPGLEL